MTRTYLGFKKRALGAIKRKAHLGAGHGAFCNTRRALSIKRGLFALFVEAGSEEERSFCGPSQLKFWWTTGLWTISSEKHAKQAYDPLIDDYDLDNEEDEECVVTKASGASEPIYYTRANAPQKSKGKGASSSSTPKVPPPKKTESKRLHQLIDEDDEDDEEMEEEFGVSEDDEEDVELGIDVDDDEEEDSE
ncbi:hypothetical protein E3N88_36740 [Mikania micrantha]|uniref:Uncharacterized protein n=1 Tax=Mikania micrantha TaxID=192012 RepID=A0A5N6M4I0_9ASTR|nr:hypothetical protein E3N88_36740 [Mikania micrantha]